MNFPFPKLKLFVDSRTVMAILGKLHSIPVSTFCVLLSTFFCRSYLFNCAGPADMVDDVTGGLKLL